MSDGKNGKNGGKENGGRVKCRCLHGKINGGVSELISKFLAASTQPTLVFREPRNSRDSWRSFAGLATPGHLVTANVASDRELEEARLYYGNAKEPGGLVTLVADNSSEQSSRTRWSLWLSNQPELPSWWQEATSDLALIDQAEEAPESLELANRKIILNRDQRSRDQRRPGRRRGLSFASDDAKDTIQAIEYYHHDTLRWWRLTNG